MSAAPTVEVTDGALAQAKPPFLRRVRIRGYKSIAFCDVTLEPLTILVGRNASGKSNFLDALAFVQDAMETNITEATKRHGGWHSILSRSATDGEVVIEVELSLSSGSLLSLGLPPDSLAVAEYGFVLRKGPSDSPVVISEWFRTPGSNGTDGPHYRRTGTFDSSRKRVNYTWNFDHPQVDCSQVPQPRPDRLWIGSFGNQPFLDVSDSLRLSGYYNFQPQVIRLLQKPAPGAMLARDGSNLASVIETTREIEPWAMERAARYTERPRVGLGSHEENEGRGAGPFVRGAWQP